MMSKVRIHNFKDFSLVHIWSFLIGDLHGWGFHIDIDSYGWGKLTSTCKAAKTNGANLKIFKSQNFHRLESLKFTVARHVGISKYLVFKRDHISQETPPGLILTRWLNSKVHCQISWPKLHALMLHAKLSCRNAFQIVGDWHIWPHTECRWCPLSFICPDK